VHQHGAGDSGGVKKLRPPNENHRKVDKKSARTGKDTKARQAA
jgi:hypothetical protein